MIRSGVIKMPVAELAGNVLITEKDEEGTFVKGKQRIKIDRFPHEYVEFVLSLTDEQSSSSALRPCHYNFRRDDCTCKPNVRRKSHIIPIVYFKLDLAFENYLHEMSHNYKYRITCNMSLECGKEQQICSFDEIRTTKNMNFSIRTDHRIDCILKELNEAIIFVEIDRFCIIDNVSLNKFQDCFKALLDNPVHSDVIIKVGNSSIRAHKNILSCRSIVFHAMFNCQMTENKTGIVNIVDVPSEVMQELLYYMYTGRSENMDKMPMDLFEAAVKYQLDDLKIECIEFLMFHVNPENIVKISQLFEMYDVQELTSQISAFMKKYKRIVRNIN